ncbi:TetR/AcrR family transcriptional regulator [Amycolatopsis jiangsuensis]|uniref:AcrR family transcriptional regulator n=1 Tax=Amycolatopsis jiangsuensis TaxID=1181879 RepID=A0A840IS35_9PSEU|nr:TetR/AcrR family transcriptional regulator [Amycolatopsis jiangsuensis]MBB4684359.1 AcrR family transcriptional regulator [Amycolatopsis jiangsuensis]
MTAEEMASPAPRRRMRADAQRSIEQIVAAAERLIERVGPGVALEEVAKEAGVGPATLYRHFPSRMHLFERIYGDRTARIAERAHALAGTGEPWETLTQWLGSFVALGLESQGVLIQLMSQGLQQSDAAGNAERGHKLVSEALNGLLNRAKEAAAVREDVDAEDVLSLVSGVVVTVGSRADTTPDERRGQADRALRIVLRGISRP